MFTRQNHTSVVCAVAATTAEDSADKMHSTGRFCPTSAIFWSCAVDEVFPGLVIRIMVFKFIRSSAAQSFRQQLSVACGSSDGSGAACLRKISVPWQESPDACKKITMIVSINFPQNSQRTELDCRTAACRPAWLASAVAMNIHVYKHPAANPIMYMYHTPSFCILGAPTTKRHQMTLASTPMCPD